MSKPPVLRDETSIVRARKQLVRDWEADESVQLWAEHSGLVVDGAMELSLSLGSKMPLLHGEAIPRLTHIPGTRLLCPCLSSLSSLTYVFVG